MQVPNRKTRMPPMRQDRALGRMLQDSGPQACDRKHRISEDTARGHKRDCRGKEKRAAMVVSPLLQYVSWIQPQPMHTLQRRTICVHVLGSTLWQDSRGCSARVSHRCGGHSAVGMIPCDAGKFEQHARCSRSCGSGCVGASKRRYGAGTIGGKWDKANADALLAKLRTACGRPRVVRCQADQDRTGQLARRRR